MDCWFDLDTLCIVELITYIDWKILHSVNFQDKVSKFYLCKWQYKSLDVDRGNKSQPIQSSKSTKTYKFHTPHQISIYIYYAHLTNSVALYNLEEKNY